MKTIKCMVMWALDNGCHHILRHRWYGVCCAIANHPWYEIYETSKWATFAAPSEEN